MLRKERGSAEPVTRTLRAAPCRYREPTLKVPGLG